MRLVPVIVLGLLLGGCSTEEAYYMMGGLLRPVAAPAIKQTSEDMIKAQVLAKGGTPAQAACAFDKVRQSLSDADYHAAFGATPDGPEQQKIKKAYEAAIDSCMAN